ncbi:phage tail sheath subtilisin-like domain-containing protein [Ornithinimicrobium ciconiae]|uniref:phage tail sheath subtilisin-like domain-containing protein n=1 Tax=Ornithinimicrobium ciconiae TaxID=2594265 RepID=UPI0013FD00C3|nr:phage tail sheath subtilisin-like domain-containing protein [Ornithinimicrobium ciconiae]
MGRPVRVATAADYHDTFGPSLDAARPLGHAVDLFFANGGDNAIIVRAPGASAEELVPPDGTEHAEALDGSGVTVLVIPGLTTGHTAQVRRALRRCASYSAVLLLDPPAGDWRASTEQDLTSIPEHRDRAAVYHPWVLVGGRAVPPTGAVAGVIARTDAARGVWKTPAGSDAVLHGIEGLATPADHQLAESLTLAGVNPLRESPGRGPVVWGARVLSAAQAGGAAQRYLPVRRLADHVRRSISTDLGWVVFEQDEPDLWQRVRVMTEEFLMALFEQGALVGSRPRDAFFVQVGLGQTMTAEDVAAGLLRLEVGISPLRPAEFEVLRIVVPTASARDAASLLIERADGREDGEQWAESHERLPGGAGISLILESTTRPGVGPRLHQHPYPETFVIRRGSAVFTVGAATVPGRAGQILVVPAETAHTFVTGPDGYEGLHLHESDTFETEWLE